MSSSCLSAATIVRCVALSKMQNGIVFVPVAVQIIFLVSLSAFFWRSGRKRHYIVLADGSAFYIIALLDLLSHLLPMARNHLGTFKSFDIAVAALSFVPIILYTTFLFVFAQTYFFPTLPRVSRGIMKYALLALIPITITMNELGSFLGIGYQVLQNSQGQSYLAIGFGSPRDQTLWQSFTIVTLALLIVFQAFIFSFSVYIGISLFNERRLSRNYFEGFNMPTLSGVAWVAIGVKLGVVESVLGFVDGGFPIVLTRRILRMVSRCSLAYGALLSEGATISRGNHRRSRTMSQIRAMISNPRSSTFVRLSPTAGEFYSNPRAVEVRRQQHGEEPISRPQLVTVNYDGRGRPELELRLSGLDMPPAEVLTARFHKRGTIISDASYEKRRADAHSKKSSSRSMTRSLSAIAPASAPIVDMSTLPLELKPVLRSRNNVAIDMSGLPSSVRPNPKFSSAQEQRQSNGTNSDLLFPDGHRRFMSSSSLASDSLSIVHNLASQFPGIPPRRTVSGRRLSYSGSHDNGGQTLLEGVEEATEKGTIKSGVSPSSSIKRKPPPTLVGNLTEGTSYPGRTLSQKSSSDNSNLSQSSSFRRKNVPPPIDSSIAGPNVTLPQRMSVSPDTATSEATRYSSARRSEHARDYTYTSSRTTSTTARMQMPGMVHTSGNSPTEPETDLATVRDMDDTIDPFADSDDGGEAKPEYRISELATAESGLNLVASRLAEYDRERRRSYRAVRETSPAKYGQVESRSRERKAKAKNVEGEWDMVEFPSVNAALGVHIGRPRRISAQSNGSSASLQNATVASGRRVTVSTRRGPKYSDATILHAPFAHAHTTSTSSAQTLASHTERELMRIKSMGRVATRRTPMPTPSTGSFATRQSVHVDSVDFSGSEMTDKEGADTPSPVSFRQRPLYESGSTSVIGVHSALREEWKAVSDDETDFPDVFRSERGSGFSPRR